jgi:integrase/recombinase XerD
MKVTIYLRTKQGYRSAVWDGKKLKPLWGSLKDTSTHYPDALGYYLRYQENGKRVTKFASLDPVDAVTFQKHKAAKLDGVAVAPLPTESVRRTWDEAVEGYKTWLETEDRHPQANKVRLRHLEIFKEGWGKTYIDEICREDVLLFKRALEKRYDSAATVNAQIMTVVVFGKWAGYPGLMKGIKLGKVPKKPEPFTEPEINALMEAATPDEQLLFRFFLVTGCRKREVAYAEYSDLTGGTYEVKSKLKKYQWKPKTVSSLRHCPLNAQLLEDLKARQAANPGVDLIFPRAGEPDLRMLEILKAVAKRAGVENAYLHRFRDTFATRLLRKGRDLITVAKRLGHGDLETIQSYVEAMRLDSDETRRDVDEMDYRPGPQLVRKSA